MSTCSSPAGGQHGFAVQRLPSRLLRSSNSDAAASGSFFNRVFDDEDATSSGGDTPVHADVWQEKLFEERELCQELEKQLLELQARSHHTAEELQQELRNTQRKLHHVAQELAAAQRALRDVSTQQQQCILCCMRAMLHHVAAMLGAAASDLAHYTLLELPLAAMRAVMPKDVLSSVCWCACKPQSLMAAIYKKVSWCSLEHNE